MNKKPLIERLKTAYDRQQFSWFVIDGKGNTMHEGLDELTAREYSMKDDSYSIGWAHTMPMKDDPLEKVRKMKICWDMKKEYDKEVD